MSIRRATRTDLSAIGALIEALADYESLRHEVVWSLDSLDAELFGSAPAAQVLLAVEGHGVDETVVGFALWFETFSTFLGRRGIWLEDLFVVEECRGRGHGRALLSALMDEVGDGRLEWAVLDWNQPSIEFYESMGAAPVRGWTRYRWVRDPAAVDDQATANRNDTNT